VVDGLEVVNGDININVDKNGNVISYGDSFYKGRNQKESLTIKEWIKKEAETVAEQGRQLSFGNWRHRGSSRKVRNEREQGNVYSCWGSPVELRVLCMVLHMSGSLRCQNCLSF
jgi:uncharacterized protein YuzE